MLRWIYLPLAGWLTIACAETRDRSEQKQLTQTSFVCPANSSRLQGLKERYPDQFFSGTTQHQADAWDVLTLMPNEYLRWNFDVHNLKIELRQAGGSVRGMTSSTNAGDGWYPSAMWVGQKTGTFDPLLHEFGHASEHYMTKAIPEFQSELDVLYNWVVANGEANYMRSYAKSNATEMFAELFDSYYCGEESRAFMAEKMPRTYYFAQRFLIDPSKLETGTVGNDSLRGAELDVDPDKDGVAGTNDKCPDTPTGANVWFNRQHYGCSAGQTPQ